MRTTTPCAARLSSDMSRAAMVETTAVQSVQVSAVAKLARLASREKEEKRNTFNAEVS